MHHLHCAVALAMALLCATFFSAAQAQTEQADTTLCNMYMDSVKLYSYRYDANDSLRYYGLKLLDCAEQVHDQETKMEALSVLGVTYLRDNDYIKALDYFKQNERAAIELKDSAIQAEVLINIGAVYTRMDSMQIAMETLMRSASILELRKDSSMLIYVYTNIGIIMGKIKNREQQLVFSKKAFAMSNNEITDGKSLTLASNLAVNYLNSGIVDTAYTMGMKVLEKSREIGNLKTTTQILTHLANASNRLEQYEQTLIYADEVLEHEGKLKHDQTFASALVYRGIALLKLGRVNESIISLEKGLQYARNEKSLLRRELALKHLRVAYAKAGRFEDAYNTMVLYKQANDTLASEENVRILNDLETKYQTEKKEQQVRELSQQNQISELKLKQRNVWIIVLIILAVLVVASVYFVYRQRLLKQERETLENRLLSLRVQLNPHFIFNALTAVQNYMLSGKDLREATRYLSNFAKVMRAFLEYNQDEQISLMKEMDALELYIGIQKLRFSNGFEFDLKVDENLDPEEVMVPPMILQPLIENAIEHGIRNVENGKITLNYSLQDGFLVMRVSDNGVGRGNSSATSTNSAEKTSLATRITEERISLLNRQGKGKYSFEIGDLNEDGTGTVVTFKIPWETT